MLSGGVCVKKFITLILLLSITISGCGIDDTPASESAPVNSVGSSSESSQPNITVIPYAIDLSREFQPFKNEPSKDYLHIINTGYTDKKIYVNDQTSGYNNLKVIDTENNTMTTICKKTDCCHTDDGCDGYIPDGYEFISTRNNEYIIYKDITRDEDYPFTQTTYYYRMDSNGQNRKLLYSHYGHSLDFYSNVFQCGNKLYFHSRPTGAFNGILSCISCLDIETGQYEPIASYDSPYAEILGIYKDKLMVCVEPFYEGDYYTAMSLHLLDVSTHENRLIYTAPEYYNAVYLLYNNCVYELIDGDIFTLNKINPETGDIELFYQNTSLQNDGNWRTEEVFNNVAIFRASSRSPYLVALNLDTCSYYTNPYRGVAPFIMYGETENNFLINVGNTERFYSQEEEKQKHDGVSNYFIRNYAFISKSDFLKGIKNYTLLEIT